MALKQTKKLNDLNGTRDPTLMAKVMKNTTFFPLPEYYAGGGFNHVLII